MALDVLIRGGMIVDGTGTPGYVADVGIADGRIAAIGKIAEPARQVVDAEGLVVSPGFIDGHTHFDAQVNWDPLGSCSCWHGVTTVVMGNCGFTLAPSREGKRSLVVRCLERAEDISPAALAEGIRWEWETFPEYLDVVDGLPKGINYITNVGHSALRTWAMGERAFEEEATEDDLRLMEQQLAEGLRAGAIGFTTSRTPSHATTDDKPVASRLASWEEVCRLVGVVGRSGNGLFEIAQDGDAISADPELRAAANARLEALAIESGVPMTFGIVPGPVRREAWQDQLDLLDRMSQRGVSMFGQTHCRGLNVLLSGKTQLPFDKLPSWREVRSKPLEEQKRLLRDPAVRTRLIEATEREDYGSSVGVEASKPNWDLLYIYDGPFPPYVTVAEAASKVGRSPLDHMIEMMIESDFDQFFMQVGNKIDDDDLLTAIRHPRTIMTFSDSGAHVSQIADSSLQVHLLSYWARQREVFTLEEAVKMVTAAQASALGLRERGMVKEGMIADLNVFDYARLNAGMPTVANDLPGGAKRLITRSQGIEATIVGGEILFRQGEHTGALPGQLLRGPFAGSSF